MDVRHNCDKRAMPTQHDATLVHWYVWCHMITHQRMLMNSLNSHLVLMNGAMEPVAGNSLLQLPRPATHRCMVLMVLVIG